MFAAPTTGDREQDLHRKDIRYLPPGTYQRVELFFSRLTLCGIDWGDIVRALEAVRITHPESPGFDNWSEWYERWRALARGYEAAADQALAAGRRVTGRRWLLKASACNHFAEFMYSENPEEKSRTRREVTRLFEQAIPHLEHPVRPIAIPHGARTLPGYFLQVDDDERPCVILINGLDSAKEVELWAFAQEFLARGVSALVFDGPGQGLLAGVHPMVVDFEAVFESVLAHARQESRINEDRIGVFGVSFGGYLASRCASFHQRDLRACINLSGGFHHDNYRQMSAMVRRNLVHAFGARDQDEMDAIARSQINLRSAPHLGIPLLSIHGKLDGVITHESCLEMMSWARGEKHLIDYERERHVCTNYFSDFIPRMCDWMSEKLA